MKTALPLVSIILPTFNGARYLREAIAACLAQTWPNLELILVDDGSTDAETREILDQANDPRVVLLRLEKNSGLPQALNKGFARARGDLLTWTSDDNLYRPHAIACMARAIQKSGADFVYARATVMDKDGNETGIMVPKPPDQLVIDNGIGPCFLFTREVYARTGGFDPAAPLAEDYDYWVRVSKQFRMLPVRDDLYLYRFHPKTLTSAHGKTRVEEAVEKVRRKHFPRSRICAADGLRAFDRGERGAAARLLAEALVRNPFAFRLYRPAAIVIFPAFLVRALVAGKSFLKRP